MDPITTVIGMAPPETIPALVIAYLLYKAAMALIAKMRSGNPSDSNKPDVEG